MKYAQKYTVKEWNRFCKQWTGDRIDGNELTAAEILLDKYKIVLTDHVTKGIVKWKRGEYWTEDKDGVIRMYKESFHIKDKLKNIPKHITQQNFDKVMKKFDKGLAQFNKAVAAFSSGLDSSGAKSQSKKDKANISKLMGNGNSQNVKIWSQKQPKQRRRKSQRSQHSQRSQGDRNVEKLWGKRR